MPISVDLTPENFDEATKKIDKNGVPHNRRSVYYDLVINGKAYPPKYIISIATKFATGEELSPSKFTAREAKTYLETKGYRIIDRRL
jgi:hypothetical protein